MSVLAFLNHLLNFAAPALFVSLLLAVMARFAFRRRAVAGFWRQAAINFAAGLVVLVAGLGYFGRDGVMATYAALVLVCGTSQWLLAGGLRR
ncbi:MAG: hypothetical protein V4636_10650 [Pseudomonadota bacterium]